MTTSHPDSNLPLELVYEGLRAWARGTYHLEAATELLIRTGWAQPSLPWVFRCDVADDNRAYWHGIDWTLIQDHVQGYQGAEKRLLWMAASLGADPDRVLISLAECVNGIERDKLDLVLAAIAHAATDYDHGGPDETTGIPQDQRLHPWPEWTPPRS